MAAGKVPGGAQDAQQDVDLGDVPGRVGHHGIGRDVARLGHGMWLAPAFADQLQGQNQVHRTVISRMHMGELATDHEGLGRTTCALMG